MDANDVNQLEAEIRECFPLGEGAADQYDSKLITDAVNGIGTEYMEIGYELSAMYFDDALGFLPVILLGELRLFAEDKLDQCFMCVVYLIVDWGDFYVSRLSPRQRLTLLKWLHVLSDGRELVNTSIVKSALDKVFRILNVE